MRVRDRGAVRYLHLNITNNCNMKCKHCWSKSGEIQEDKEIAGKDFITAIAELLPLGLRKVVISGGEPLLRFEALKEIAAYCANHGSLIALETNGTLLTKEMVSALKKYLYLVSVSLDFLDESSFEEFRGLKGSYKKTVNSIKLLVREGVRTQVIMSVYSENLQHIKKLAEFVIKVLCVDSFKVGPVISKGRAKVNLRDKLLSAEEILDLTNVINELIERYPQRIVPDMPSSLISTRMNSYIRSRDCENVLAIFANGDISLCSGFFGKDVTFGNIGSRSIHEVWDTDSKLRAIRRSLRTSNLHGVCRICILKRYCKGYCPAHSYEKYNKFSPYPICQQLYEKDLFPQEMIIPNM